MRLPMASKLLGAGHMLEEYNHALNGLQSPTHRQSAIAVEDAKEDLTDVYTIFTMPLAPT